MQKIVTGQQMRAIDKCTIEDLSIPSIVLMENAGRAVFETIRTIIEENDINNPSVLIICGKGNNGGDGFVAARHLLENDIQTTVLSLYRPDSLKNDALTNHNALDHFTNILYYDSLSEESIIELIENSDIVTDAILGTGIKNRVKGIEQKLISLINEFSDNFIISVDIASGINADNGDILGDAVIADYTTTFFAPKIGNVIHPGADYCGDLFLADIGIPEYLINDSRFFDKEYNINLLTQSFIGHLIPLRPPNSNKGSFGKVLNISGSFGMAGAAYLSAFSALKVGAGYSTVATPQNLVNTMTTLAPELVMLPLDDENFITPKSLDKIMQKAINSQITLIGPGLGTNDETIEFVSEFIIQAQNHNLKCIFDADALNCISQLKNISLPSNSVLTPHPLELSRLLGIDVKEIEKNRIQAVQTASKRFNCIVILKGSRSLISHPDGRIFINPTGNSALATAGTGDVLAGMITGFTAQGANLLGATLAGVYLHGLTGDLCSEEFTEYSTTATDVLNAIPTAIKELI